MNIKTIVAALIAVAMLTGVVSAQPPAPKPVQEVIGDRAADTTGELAPAPASRWLTSVPDLAQTEAKGPPIAAEVYFATGASVPFSSSFNHRDVLGRDMVPGVLFQGGVRTLFFNMPATRAWVIDTSISHTSNGHDQNVRYPLRVIDFTGNTNPLTGQPEVALIQFGTPTTPAIRIRETHRTYANLGIGRDYYWRTSADDPGRLFRYGWQTGGRYGTLSQEYNIIKHRTDVIGGFFAGLHGEFEYPSRWGMLQLGVRCEYGYTWTDILQRASDIQEINTMFNIGVRY